MAASRKKRSAKKKSTRARGGGRSAKKKAKPRKNKGKASKKKKKKKAAGKKKAKTKKKKNVRTAKRKSTRKTATARRQSRSAKKKSKAGRAKKRPTAKKKAKKKKAPTRAAKAAAKRKKRAPDKAAKKKKKRSSNRIRICKELDCSSQATTQGFCRLHYIMNWKELKAAEQEKNEKKLNRYVERMMARHGRGRGAAKAIRKDIQEGGVDGQDAFLEEEMEEYVEAVSKEKDLDSILGGMKVED